MTDSGISFREWLVSVIMSTLNRDTDRPPMILWCDPERRWRELLERAAAGNFTLWSSEENELILRDNLYRANREARVVWIPRSRQEITWLKIFELEAEEVWEKDLVQSLREYGVSVPGSHEKDLRPQLPALVAEWFDMPMKQWDGLTPRLVGETLVNNGRVLKAIVEGGEFSRLREQELFGVFARRVTGDFGLPDPTHLNEKQWRVMATASLLCTEAAELNPDCPPTEGNHVIPPGNSHRNALQLLRNWQDNVRYIPSFEQLVLEADATLSLRYWAEKLSSASPPLSSRVVEETLFHKYANQAIQTEGLDALAENLAENFGIFKSRESAFWETLSSQKIGWGYLHNLAQTARAIIENRNVEKQWTTPQQAVNWYADEGWRLDSVGGALFEDTDLPQELDNIRNRLRRAYIRTMDRIGRTFSELVANQDECNLGLPTAGELALTELQTSQMPTAIIFLDACRYEYGQHLAEAINKGEPAERAKVTMAIAPLPSITPIGMAFALPMSKECLNIQIEQGKGFRVITDDSESDLAIMSQRREWLQTEYRVQKFLTPKEVLGTEKISLTKKTPRMVVVYAAEFDRAGHEGELQLRGASDYIDRYARMVRTLRDQGFRRIIILTDHGFFNWEPDKSEIEEEKPEGEVLWTSRRAIVGRNLSHGSALIFQVPQSDLEIAVPRSMNAFKTYGGLGYFHGGATLQELLIPVIIVKWPAKAIKIKAVLKHVGNITSEVPRIEVEPGISGQQKLGGSDDKLLSRQVLVKIRDPSTGKLVFKHDEPINIEPGGKKVAIQLRVVEPKPALSHGTPLEIELRDADDEELLAKEEVILRLDIDEW